MKLNVLTHSCMSSYKSCARKFYYAYIEGIRKDRTSAPLRFGGNFHNGLDWLAQGVSLDEVCNRIRAAYAEAPDWALAEEGGLDEWLTECETVVRLLCGYVWRWGEDKSEVVATEQVFDVPIVNPETGASSRTFRLQGKIDKIVRLEDGRVAVREHKTTGDDISALSDYWKRLRVDQQISTYMLAALTLGHQVETVEYDVIRKPGIEPRKLTKAELKTLTETGEYCGESFSPAPVERESPEMYGARLSQDIAARPDFYFARQEIPRLAADIEEFRVELWQIAEQVRESRAASRWFRNTDACLRPYRCEFFEPCMAGAYPLTETPQGYVRLENVHPELQGESDERSTNQTAADETAACSTR